MAATPPNRLHISPTAAQGLRPKKRRLLSLAPLKPRLRLYNLSNPSSYTSLQRPNKVTPPSNLLKCAAAAKGNSPAVPPSVQLSPPLERTSHKRKWASHTPTSTSPSLVPLASRAVDASNALPRSTSRRPIRMSWQTVITPFMTRTRGGNRVSMESKTKAPRNS
ncbi:hypothetical protein BDY21DRAFT_128597 [Lineolata rhizophorae]|uniref:Uncharacterized protein n=1 Tax=Lineolata rhizophorae TaxID=578093 RepID=A0A6A6NNN9_9PEZI|nr:hypothetical protein BDY21DRAFT_128597 [Lineolata rhizophorae]